MVLQAFPNYRFDNGILTRGMFIDSRVVIKPDSQGRYKVKKKGVEYLLTEKELLKPQVSKVIKTVKSKSEHSSIIIDLHLKGLSTKEIAEETRKSESYINKVKKKFIGVTSFSVMCKNFHIGLNDLKNKCKIDENIYGISYERRLQFLSIYLKKYKRNAKTREELCLEEFNVHWGNVKSWCYYNKVKVTADNWRECVKRWLNDRHETKGRALRKN